MISFVVAIQFLTFLVLGTMLCVLGDYRLGAAQLLLGIITLLVYL